MCMPGDEDKVDSSSHYSSITSLRVSPSCVQGGRLGLGTEEDVCTPKEVGLSENIDLCNNISR